MPGFTYRLHFADGEEAGEASYAAQIKPEDLIHVNGGKKFRVTAVVFIDDEHSPYTGLLEVEPV